MSYEYTTNCVGCGNGQAISDMVNCARQVSYATLAKHVGIAQLAEGFPDYDWGYGTARKLRMKNDWAVTYWKSIYLGKPCYYINHSAIEYVYCKVGQ